MQITAVCTGSHDDHNMKTHAAIRAGEPLGMSAANTVTTALLQGRANRMASRVATPAEPVTIGQPPVQGAIQC